jgi:nicotinate-nucleotide adenylyltransferase
MIGILGGTFDPIHNGHLHIATQLVNRLSLEQLQLMPCATPVHRDLPRASTTHRCAMIDLAIAGQQALSLNTVEIDRDGPSYSIDSLREIRRQTDSILALVLGADAFNGFDSWKLPQEILQLANLVVCYRPGFEVNQEMFSQHLVASPGELSRQIAGAILLLEVEAIDCSSSAVRAALDTGKIPRHYLPPTVANYIEKHNLYRKQGD